MLDTSVKIERCLPMNVMTTKEAAKLWNVTVRHVQSLCDRGLIEGAVKASDVWLLPKNAKKPADGRTKAVKQQKSPDNRRY